MISMSLTRFISSTFSAGQFITCFLCSIILLLLLKWHLHAFGSVRGAARIILECCLSCLLVKMLIPINLPFQISIYDSRILGTIIYPLTIPFPRTAINCYTVFLIIWPIGILITVVIRIRRYMKLTRVIHKYTVAEECLDRNIAEALNKNFKSGYRICVIPAKISPAVTGFLHPTVILPENENNRMEDIGLIMRHESAHFYQRHLWFSLIMDVVGIIEWWNPIIPLLKKNSDLLMEYLADEEATENCTYDEKLHYACLLLDTEKLMHKKPVSGFPSASRKFSSRERSINACRIHHLMDDDQKVDGHKKMLLCALFCLLTFCSFIFVLEPDTIQMEIIRQQEQPTDGLIITEDNAYIKNTSDGYELYVDGNLFMTFSEKGDIPEDFQHLPMQD